MISLYLPDEKEIDIFTGTISKDFVNVTCNQVVITHRGRYTTLIRQLKNLRNYLVKEDCKRTFQDVEKMLIEKPGIYGTLNYRRTENGIEVIDTTKDNVVATYVNPKAELAKLINKDSSGGMFRWNYNEDDLFLKHNEAYQLSKLINIDGTEDELKNMLEIFKNSTLSSSKKSKMLIEKFPNFGIFAIEALECIEFSIMDSFSLIELEERRKVVEAEIERRKNQANTIYTQDNIRLYEEELVHIRGGLDKEAVIKNHELLAIANRINKVLKK